MHISIRNDLVKKCLSHCHRDSDGHPHLSVVALPSDIVWPLHTATLEKAMLVKVRESNTITGDNHEQYRASQGSKPAVKPKTTRIEIADYDLLELR